METKYKFQFKSETGKVRTNNEDAFGEYKLPNGHLFVVCDGMGGHSGGEMASKKSIECIIEYCKKARSENAIIMIHEAIKFANTQIHGFASTYPEYKGMGTTCVVVFYTSSGQLYYGHVGDSRLYVYSGDRLKALTKDHSYVQYLVDTGEIQESEMETHPSKNQILRAIGIEETIRPDVCSEPYIPASGDIFLLCTDGLNGMIGNKLIGTILQPLQNTHNLSLTSDELIQSALEAGGKDNVTVGIIQISKELSDPTIVIQNQSFSKINKFNLGALILLFISIIVATFFTLNYFFTKSEKEIVPNSKTENKETTITLKKNHEEENASEMKRDSSKDSKKTELKAEETQHVTQKKETNKNNPKPNTPPSSRPSPSKVKIDNTINPSQTPPKSSEALENTIK
jgi:serine/threonine protein phosphatase PrpC